MNEPAGPVPAVRRLQAEGRLSAATLDEVIGGRPLPLVEPGACTFVYRGHADAVHLRHWGVGLPPDLGFERIDGSEVWFLVLDLPPRSRVEYKLEVSDHHGTHLFEDPLNPVRATNPFGANSVCHASGYEVPDWARHHDGVPEGRLASAHLDSAALGQKVEVEAYLPAGFTPTPHRPYPLLVVHDGRDYLHYASLKTVLDNVIARRMAPELIAVCLHPGDRLVEYADDPRHVRFLSDELMPFVESRLPVSTEPSGRCLMGASFGAVAALSAAARDPGRYGRLLLQSGSFAWSSNGCSARRGALWEPIKGFVDGYAAAPVRVSERVFMSCGVYESLICENRALLPALQRTGMEVRFHEALDGHNWESWRDCLGPAIPWLFDGPR
jgi:enterochelin esterase family protein